MMSVPCQKCESRMQLSKFNFPFWYFNCESCKSEYSFHVGGLPRGLQTA